MPTNKFSLIDIARRIHEIELSTQLSQKEKNKKEREIFLQESKKNFVIVQQEPKFSSFVVTRDS